MKKFWLFCSLCCICFSGFGQGATPQPLSRGAILSHIYNMDTSLFFIEDQAMNYIANNPNDSSFTKKFGRWVMFWEDRVDENGNFDTNFATVLNTAQSSLNKNNPVCNQNGIWSQVGPYYTGQKSGIVVSVYSPKSNPNIIYIGSNSSGLWKTTDGGLTWNNMTDDMRLPSLGINSIVGDPNDPDKLFIATGFNSNYIPGSYGLGVLMSYDGGITWYETGLNWATHSWDAIAVDKLIVHPSSSKIWGLSANGVYELSASSISGTGTTIWDKMVNINNTSTWNNLLDPLNSNLSTIHNGSDFIDMEFVPSNTQVIFLSTRLKGSLTHNSGRLYKSVNGGGTWSLVNNLPTNTSYLGICVVEAAEEDTDVPNRIFVHCLDCGNSSTCNSWSSSRTPLYYSDDLGLTWVTLNTNVAYPADDFEFGLAENFPAFEVMPNDDQVIYVGGAILHKSVDRGASFQYHTSYNNKYPLITGTWTHADVRAINLSGTNYNILFLGTDGGILRSTNAGNDYDNLGTTDLVMTQFFDIATSSVRENIIMGGTQDNGYFSNLNGSWNVQIWGDGGQTITDWSNNNIVYTRFNGRLYKSNNGGATMSSISHYAPGTNWSDDYTHLEQSSKSPDILYLGKNTKGEATENEFQVLNMSTSTGTLIHSFPGTNHQTNFPGFRRLSAFASAPSNPDIIYLSSQYNCTTGAKFFKSEDGGNSWKSWDDFALDNCGIAVDCNNSPFRYYSTKTIVVDPHNPDRLYMGMTNGRVSSIRLSEDGGCTWTDVTFNFPQTLIHDLKYQRGTDDLLYAGTDMGVFYYDRANSSWECYNNGIPVCIVYDLEIDYCKKKLYAGTFGRGIWESPLLIDANYREEITQNTIWEDGVYNASSSIVVKSGKRLTVKDCTINMAEGTSIIVEPGAELIVDGATLTNGCGDMWDGIVVKGDKGASQYGTFPNREQGLLITRNNARIEYALDAIRVWDPIDGGGISKTGGIVQAKRTTFLNNRRDVEFMKYDNGVENLSTFIQCDFKLDDDYRTTDLDDRVTMWHVNGIKFAGCTFEMDNAYFEGNHQRAGIYSIDAGYDVGASCFGLAGYPCVDDPVLIRSNFKNLYYGVRASATNNHTIRVNKTDFLENVYGVLVEEMDNIQVTESTFDVGNGSGPNFGNIINVGVAIHSGTGYEVQENTFTGTGSYGLPNSVGTHVLNTGAAQNKIYKNTFDGLYVANNAVGVNNDNGLLSGLQYLCNGETNNNFDINVYDGSGIRFYQGETQSGPQNLPQSDGNTFSNNGSPSGTYSDYNVEFGTANQVHRFYKPGEYANDVTPNGHVQQTSAHYNNTCPSRLEELDEVTVLHDKAGKAGEYESNETAYNNTAYLYDNLMDGGNTQGLSNHIQFDWSDDAWQMRDELIAESPNLSEEILLEAAFTGTLPDALLMEVLLANPRSVRNPEFHEILLNEIPNPLPQNMVDMLPFANETPSVRANLEQQMAHYDYKKSSAARILVHYALRDSIVNLDTVKYWLERDNTPKGKFALAEHYLSNGQYTAAQNTLNSVQTNFVNYYERNSATYQAYQQLMTLKVNILQNNRTWLDINESERGQLQTIAYGSNDDAAFQARSILCFFFDECVEEGININGATPPARIIQIDDAMLELTESLTNFKVYPNPATDYVNFDYQLPEYVQEASIIITNITGSVVAQIAVENTEGQLLWDTRNVENGIYFYALKQGDKTLASGKVSILK